MATSILSLSEQGREIYDLSGMAAAINMCLEMRDSGFNEQGEQAEAGIEALVPELARRMTALYESYHETHNTDGEVRERAVTGDKPAAPSGERQQRVIAATLRVMDGQVAAAREACDCVEKHVSWLRGAVLEQAVPHAQQ